MNRKLSRRGGLTLVEIIVVLGIVALLAGLLVPAVQRAREAGNVTLCTNNLRGIGQGLHQFHTTFNTFPSNGGWDGKQTISSITGNPVFVSTTVLSGKTFTWGVGDPTLPPD